MFRIEPLALEGIYEITPPRHRDERGFFSETYVGSRMLEHGLPDLWVQDNQSYSVHKHVLRGLHYQCPPMAQDKLVRVTKGSIFDVAVDIRQGSANYGKWISLVVSAEKWNQIFVPKGFAHGFLTLEPHCEVLYKVTAPYSPQYDRAIRWNDPDIDVDWSLAGLTPILAAKDSAASMLKDQETGFNVLEMPL